jgi:hypothetical protein
LSQKREIFNFAAFGKFLKINQGIFRLQKVVGMRFHIPMAIFDSSKEHLLRFHLFEVQMTSFLSRFFCKFFFDNPRQSRDHPEIMSKHSQLI